MTAVQTSASLEKDWLNNVREAKTIWPKDQVASHTGLSQPSKPWSSSIFQHPSTLLRWVTMGRMLELASKSISNINSNSRTPSFPSIVAVSSTKSKETMWGTKGNWTTCQPRIQSVMGTTPQTSVPSLAEWTKAWARTLIKNNTRLNWATIRVGTQVLRAF